MSAEHVGWEETCLRFDSDRLTAFPPFQAGDASRSTLWCCGALTGHRHLVYSEQKGPGGWGVQDGGPEPGKGLLHVMTQEKVSPRMIIILKKPMLMALGHSWGPHDTVTSESSQLSVL